VSLLYRESHPRWQGNRARWLTIDNGHEILALEVAPGFDVLPKSTKSDLRRALAVLAEFETSKLQKQRKPRRSTALPSPVETDAALKEAA